MDMRIVNWLRRNVNLRIALIGLAIFSIQSLLVLTRHAEFTTIIQEQGEVAVDNFFRDAAATKSRKKARQIVNVQRPPLDANDIKQITGAVTDTATIKDDGSSQATTAKIPSTGKTEEIKMKDVPPLDANEVTGTATARDDGSLQTSTVRIPSTEKTEEIKQNADHHSEQIQPKKPLNILLLYPDDWRHDTIGGVAPVVRTPFLNELAADGIRFTHNCVTTSVCWISRATLFTGQYVSRHRSYTLKQGLFQHNFSNESWPGILRNQAGYYTGHFGKWQYTTPPKFFEKNFNESIISGGRHWANVGGVLKHDSDVARDNALKFLKHRPKDRPFAMTVAFYPPKAIGGSTEPGGQWFPKPDTMDLFVNDTVPLPRPDLEESWNRIPKQLRRKGPARDRFLRRFNTTEKYQAAMKNYYRLVYTVDDACRTLVDKLKEQGVYNDTLIIFTTDNGLFHGEHGLAGKWYPYQESIRVPLIIRDPRMPKEKRGTLDDSLTLNIDLAETILGAAGIQPLQQMQGRDMSELYLGNNGNDAPWRKEFYYEWVPPNDSPRFPNSTALVRKEFKYIHWPQQRLEQLFDLSLDPMEENDVVRNGTYTSILKEMRRRHNHLQKVVK